jgi:hypothetical protein
MRVAIAISGHMKNYVVALGSFMRNLVIPNNADLFFYIFEDRYPVRHISTFPQEAQEKYSSKVTKKELEASFGEIRVKKVVFVSDNIHHREEVDRLYDVAKKDASLLPKALSFPMDDLWIKHSIVEQYYGRYYAMSLVPDTYDVCIYTRPEVIFPSPLIVKDPGESAVVIDYRGPDDVWVSEQILFGRTPLMKKLSVDIKENMFKYLTSGKDRRGPEHLIARLLETKGYDIVRGIIVDWQYLPPVLVEGHSERVFMCTPQEGWT